MLSPNGYYQQSHLLFWAILLVASRRYVHDPSLLTSLSTPTFRMALAKIASPTADIHTVEALLLLVSWHFPSSQYHEECSYVLSR